MSRGYSTFIWSQVVQMPGFQGSEFNSILEISSNTWIEYSVADFPSRLSPKGNLLYQMHLWLCCRHFWGSVTICSSFAFMYLHFPSMRNSECIFLMLLWKFAILRTCTGNYDLLGCLLNGGLPSRKGYHCAAPWTLCGSNIFLRFNTVQNFGTYRSFNSKDTFIRVRSSPNL